MYSYLLPCTFPSFLFSFSFLFFPCSRKKAIGLLKRIRKRPVVYVFQDPMLVKFKMALSESRLRYYPIKQQKDIVVHHCWVVKERYKVYVAERLRHIIFFFHFRTRLSAGRFPSPSYVKKSLSSRWRKAGFVSKSKVKHHVGLATNPVTLQLNDSTQ